MPHIDHIFVELAEQRSLRFTGRGRLALRYAEQEAAQRRQASVGPGHLLLGVLRDQDSVAVAALRALGVQLEALASAAEELLGQEQAGPDEGPDSRLQLAAAAALDEAIGLGHTHVGTEHLLLGLLREAAFARVLQAAGAPLDRVRSGVVRALADWRHGPRGGDVCAVST